MLHWPSRDSLNNNSCGRRLSLLTLAFTFAASTAFCPTVAQHQRIVDRKSSVESNTFLNMASDNISGSFFNRVPDNNNNDGDDNNDNNDKDESQKKPNSPVDDANNADPFEASMAELMRKRNKKPLASKPSTLGGIPTSKATGFGKKTGPQIINKTQTTSTGKQSFVGIGKPLNNVNNPEYDDQGYTLYADEETGKKQRVFEALIEYPCEFKMKIIGANEGTFAKEMVQVVADSCNVKSDTVKFSERVNGKWISVTVFAPVDNAEMLYSLYENIDRDPRVKFKF